MPLSHVPARLLTEVRRAVRCADVGERNARDRAGRGELAVLGVDSAALPRGQLCVLRHARDGVWRAGRGVAATAAQPGARVSGCTAEGAKIQRAGLETNYNAGTTTPRLWADVRRHTYDLFMTLAFTFTISSDSPTTRSVLAATPHYQLRTKPRSIVIIYLAHKIHRNTDHLISPCSPLSCDLVQFFGCLGLCCMPPGCEQWPWPWLIHCSGGCAKQAQTSFIRGLARHPYPPSLPSPSHPSLSILPPRTHRPIHPE